MDSGAACYARTSKAKPCSSLGGMCLTATGAPVESQGTLEVRFPLVDVHGERITVRAMFELLLVRRPSLRVRRLFEDGFAVVMGNDQQNKVEQEWKRDTSSQSQCGVSCPCVSVVGAVSAEGSRSKE